MQHSTTTSAQLTLDLGTESWMCSQEGFHASHSAWQECEREKMMNVTSSLKCLELSERLGRHGLLAKTLLASSLWSEAKHSDVSAMTWSMKATRSNVMIYRLTALDYKPWNGTSGLLQRPLASDSKGAKRTRTRTTEMKGNFREQIREDISDGIYVKPDFVMWLKGFPENWLQIPENP